jgi:hypothetical protein
LVKKKGKSPKFKKLSFWSSYLFLEHQLVGLLLLMVALLSPRSPSLLLLLQAAHCPAIQPRRVQHIGH